MPVAQNSAIETVLRYHERTKHHPNAYARSPGYLDWATQPNPFRRYQGARRIALAHPTLATEPRYDALFTPAGVPPCRFDFESVSRLFYHSLALSAWKQAPGTEPWSLRINPSSGALHPTEGYLISGPLPELEEASGVCHYAVAEHALERRRVFDEAGWRMLSEQLPNECILIGLTSVFWRESWKYGERAFRYCHHDVGHAIGAIALSAAMMGWQTRLVSGCSDEDLGLLLGVHDQRGPEAEHPDCLLAIFAQAPRSVSLRLPEALRQQLLATEPAGEPNPLSSEHRDWPIIEEVASAAQQDAGDSDPTDARVLSAAGAASSPDPRALSAEQLIRQRRSAIAMDASGSLSRDLFYLMLSRLVPRRELPPFSTLPWPPQVSLAIFAHRVDGVEPGLYLLVRHPDHEAGLREAITGEFRWERPNACPDGMTLYLLETGDARRLAELVSCQQAIAADGVFSLGMLAPLEPAVRDNGPAFYKRLFWETGLIGQVLYLEAEATGLRGTGIGCFFDDLMHQVLAIEDRAWQSLYHFTVGRPVLDPRLKTLAPYHHLDQAGA